MTKPTAKARRVTVSAIPQRVIDALAAVLLVLVGLTTITAIPIGVVNALICTALAIAVALGSRQAAAAAGLYMVPVFIVLSTNWMVGLRTLLPLLGMLFSCAFLLLLPLLVKRPRPASPTSNLTTTE